MNKPVREMNKKIPRISQMKLMNEYEEIEEKVKLR